MSKEKSFDVEFMIQVTLFKLNSHIIHHKYTKICLTKMFNNKYKQRKKNV